MRIIYPHGATPLDQNETEGLIPSIITQEQLNELEKANILDGQRWALKSRKLKRELLSYSGFLLLHKHMFGAVWSWAGTQRKTEKNIGSAPHLIPEQTENLCRDVRSWFQYKTYSLIECAVRLHHRLVEIHLFVNGNGRHARLTANLLLRFHGELELPWGASDLMSDDDKRREYITALQSADCGDYTALLKFAES